VRSGGVIFADDEALDFQQRGLPIPEYRLHVTSDGAYLAYVNRDGMLAIVDMRNQRSLIGPGEAIGQPTGMAFSPDGRSLALTVLEGNDTWRLQLRDLQSGAMRTLLEGATFASGPNDTLPLIPSPVAWTPNGLFVEHLLWGTDAPPSDVALIDPADGAKRMLREDAHVTIYPSHDGTKVAVVTGALRLGEPPTTGIAVLDVASGEEQEIVPVQQGLIRKVRWSPDGAKLLYAVSADYQAPAASIHARNADGSNPQAIEAGGPGVKAAYADIAWQDDQTALLLSPEADGNVHLYTLPLATFDIAALQPVASFARQQPDQPVDEIIYTPN
jgi:Tol biopolymer transport system component